MKLFFAICGLLILVLQSQAQDYNCEKLKSDEPTRQGYSALVVFKEEKDFQTIRGIVELNGEPFDDVYVEVFAEKDSTKRVTGCKTGSNGKFSFPGLKKGKYRIRLSRDGGYKITEIVVKVSPKSKNRSDLIGILEVGN